MLMLPAAPERKLLTAGHRPKLRCAGHLQSGLDPRTLKIVIQGTIDALSRYDFDAIAFRGLSGALVAPIVAYQMGKTLLAVRRIGESCHSDNTVEGDYNATRYVIVDDFVSTGTTVRDIAEQIYKVMPTAQCLGMYEYLFPKDRLRQLQNDSRTWWKP